MTNIIIPGAAIVVTLFAIAIFYVSSKILLNEKRNGWDVLFLNSTFAILILFFIGLIAQNIDVWKSIIIVLTIVAVGEKLIRALQSQK